MKCLVWLLLLVASIGAEEFVECPEFCECTEEGIGPYIATCSNLKVDQKFDYNIARLVLKGDGLILPDDIFELVGLQNVSTIYISDSTFKSVSPRAFGRMPYLTKLIVKNSRMKLHPDAFSATLLSELTLKQSQIDIEYGKYMFQIPSLRELYISDCQLPALPSEPFSEMPYLTHITLSSSKIKQLTSKTFSTLRDLQDVDLSDNLIKELNADVFEQNHDLIGLSLSKNSLFSLNGISIPSLKELDISLCKFSEIGSDSLSGFPNLDRLNMSGNAIRQIDDQAFSASKDLLYLDLSSNALKGTLPSNIFLQNSKLETLSLAHNPLGVLPKDLFSKMSNIYYMDLSHCELKNLEKGLFKDLTSLSRLNLAGNNLDQIKPNTLIGYIKILDLSYNNFSAIELIDFPFNSDIRKLYLMGNQLKTIDASRLVKLKHLKELDVRSCGLTSVWAIQNFKPCYEESCPAILENLNTLLISKNSIRSISTSQLELTPNLKYLDMLMNPLACNNKFNASLNWLMDHEVEPLLSDEEAFLPDEITSNPDAEKIDMPRWNAVKAILCAPKYKENILDEPTTPGIKQVSTTDCSNMEASECGVQQEAINIDEQDYMWPIIIVSISALAILLSLIVLVGFVLRWTRQRNSYGAAIIKNQLNTPRLKRGHSTIYEQLYEDPNHPTTPVMLSKNGNQTQYNFPEVVTQEKKKGYMSYLSKDCEGSKPDPECV